MSSQRSLEILSHPLICCCLLLGVLAQGCSDSETVNPGDALVDKPPAGHEAGSPDGPSLPDGPATEALVQPEASIPDQGKPEQTVPDMGKPEQTVLDMAKVDGQASCSSDSDCKVFVDCCECKGIYTWLNPPSCPVTCIINTCSSWGLTKPVAYCIKGKCVVGEGTTGSCSSATGCKLISDCCNCLAFPSTVTGPACSITTCLIGACQSQGLGGTKASCVSGLCRLMP